MDAYAVIETGGKQYKFSKVMCWISIMVTDEGSLLELMHQQFQTEKIYNWDANS